MTLQEAIRARHSVRVYDTRPLSPDIVAKLDARIAEINRDGNLRCRLVTGERKAFSTGIWSYGKFRNVTDYIVVAGRKDSRLAFDAGYYGEMLVLYAQTLGLNTCWVGLTYKKVKGVFDVPEGEKVVCCIAIGYGATQGDARKLRSPQQIGDVTDGSPDWYVRGVEAAAMAPSAVNQQKYRFRCLGETPDGKGLVEASAGFSLVGYTAIDLGIAECHFRIGAAPREVVFTDRQS